MLVDVRDAVAWVTLDRPEVRNAISLALRRDLAELFGALAGDESVRVLVLAGNGPAFCAGGDVRELAAPRTPQEDAERVADGNRMIERLHRLPFPTIAAVHGAVAGAGAALALACDLVLAAESTTFRFSFVHLGLGPDAGASALVPARVGAARARELFLLGGSLDAAEALAAGLVNRIVPDDRLGAAAADLAGELSRRSAPALAATKRLLAGPGLADALDRELTEQVALLATAEHRAAREAFLRRSTKGSREGASVE